MPVGFVKTATTQIDFDTILKWQPTRVPSKPYEMGNIDGDGVVETTGASLLTMKITILVKTDDTFPTSGQSALQKWNALDDLIKDEGTIDQTLSITFNYQGGDQTITFLGKAIKGYTSGFDAGDPDEFTFTLGFSVETKGAIV